MSRVKELREERKQQELLAEYEKRKYLAKLRDKNSPLFSNWRGTFTEGMNTGNVFATTLPSTGETDLETIATSTADSFEAVGDNAGLEFTDVQGSGSGTGSDGGFAIGNHLAFNGDGEPRWAILKPIDSSKFDTLAITAIRGNDENGGEDPDVPGEELRLYYLPPGGSSFRSISITPDGDQALGANSDVIIPLGKDDSGLREYSINLPSYARGAAFRYMLYQLTNSGTGFDNFGVTQVNYKRRTPISLFVSLDSPEAVSFISDGSGNLSPEEKKKRLEDMLAASDEYVSRQFPMNKAAYEQAARDTARNIQISLDPTTFEVPDDPITFEQLFGTQDLDSSSNDIEIDRYLEQKGKSIDTIDNTFFNRLPAQDQLNLLNTSNPIYQEKFITSLGLDISTLENLTDETYREVRKKTYLTPGGTPSTGWDGKFYDYKDPLLEKSRIVPLETYLEAIKRPNYYGAERPDRAEPGMRYVMEKPYSFSQDSEATPTYTGPQNKELDDASKTVHTRMYQVGSYGNLGYTWDLSHFEKGLGPGLEAGSNFAREQVVESVTAVLNHMYYHADVFAYMYAGGGVYGATGIDRTQQYDPLYYFLRNEKGQRALDIASNSSARQLDYPRSAFGSGSDSERRYQYHLGENDRTIESFQAAYGKIKTLNTDFTTYDTDEWYGQDNNNIIAIKKVHPYSGLTEPGDEIQEPTPQEPTDRDGYNYYPEFDDIEDIPSKLG